MKRNIFLFLVSFLTLVGWGQKVPTPDTLWGKLFEEVQTRRIFPDNKTFVDAVPKRTPDFILTRYNELRKRDSLFDLKAFVHENFIVPEVTSIPVKEGMGLKDHLNQLWNSLTRKADTLQPYSSLLPLPNRYIIPGGRFREIYYWDTYFTMLGLAASNRYDLVENMTDNFKWLIDNYGHIPNGNRNYYLSRSQPPYFALMVSVLKEKKGNSVYQKYFSALEKEYAFWMHGSEKLTLGKYSRRVIRMPDGHLLNRHWDDKRAPREEAFAEDRATAMEYKGKDGLAYTNLRASAESGWDFSARWFADTMHLNTIETTNIIPVDLNCLLYELENTLSKAATVLKQSAKAHMYRLKAERRKAAILKYCWDGTKGYFFDYDFKDRARTGRWSIAGTMPLFVNIATKPQAAAVKNQVEQKFLKDGGFLTTLYHTGQQWDAPNGWAPLQYLAVKGLLNYGYKDLAQTAAERWMLLNEKVFAATGKMMEKYNVENLDLDSGGGEYPTQDGFGWTNGVYLKFDQMFRPVKPNL